MRGQISVLTGSTSKASNNEASDSDSGGGRSLRHHAAAPPSSQFKGVVSQQNGHWGAQIYASHQRIWLGTFKTESEAAMAYDSAAIRLRNGQSHRNFAWTAVTLMEPVFQSPFATEEVLSMIKDGSYFSKFSDYLRAHNHHHHHHRRRRHHRHVAAGVKVMRLFEKELTPSDVSKLNRLVIPKKYAVKHFPAIKGEGGRGGAHVEDVEIVFFDGMMRSWKFRYCYWKSSQSYVFTRGWNRFAKEKKLRHRDRVLFSSCECGDGLTGVRKILMIDVVKLDGGGGEVVSPPVSSSSVVNVDSDDKKKKKKKGIRLFGVDIEG